MSAETTPRQCVLIVNDCEDSCEVLQTALALRGVETLSARGAQQGLQIARQHQPQVIVLDTEAVHAEEEVICEELEADSRSREGNMVLLGTLHRTSSDGFHDCVMAKPYHYAPLIRTIEQLLERGAKPHPMSATPG